MVIDCQKKNKEDWKTLLDNALKENGDIDKNAKLLFILSPNDLVYLPTEEEIRTNIFNISKDRIYKMVSSSSYQCFFIKMNVANTIVNKVEYSPLNKMERAISGEMIKETCIPIKVDRLGNIIEFNGKRKE